MSGYGNFDDEDEFIGNPGELPPARPPTLEENEVKATRSRADDILDAVAGIKKDKITKACPRCGGTEFVQRGPTVGGGTITSMCRKCRLERPIASVQSAVVPLQRETVFSGPFYTDEVRDLPNPLLPPNRIALERQKK